MLQHQEPEDFVIATGRSVSLRYFVERAFERFGLDWRDHVDHDASLLRPADIRFGSADPSHAAQRLGWKATHDVDDVIAQMSEAAATKLTNRTATQ